MWWRSVGIGGLVLITHEDVKENINSMEGSKLRSVSSEVTKALTTER